MTNKFKLKVEIISWVMSVILLVALVIIAGSR